MKQSELDTPEHHYLAGNSLLDKGDLDGAMAEFERAKGLDPKYAPAYVGIGLVQGEKGTFDQAFAAMGLAKGYASSDAEKVLYNTGMIRLYTKSQQEDWLKKAQGHFKKASGIDSMDPAPCYYMGLAYKKAGEYGNASDLFKKVIDLNKGYREQADTEWEKVQNIVRAQPGTKAGKDIAKLEKITRADVAALFVEEMNLDKIFDKHNVSLKKKGAETEEESAPNDYHDHILKSDIEKVNALGIKGLEIIGNRFDPNAVITRADFAIMCEDIQ
jgi:tetratricopeptide (TPR) repeat protein